MVRTRTDAAFMHEGMVATAPSGRNPPSVMLRAMANASAWDQDGSWQDLPRLEGDAVADVRVVGLGGSGPSAVHTLLELGIGNWDAA